MRHKVLFAALSWLAVPASALAATVLGIPPTVQQTDKWCWLATGEMIFRYYGVPANHPTDFQCGMARFEGSHILPPGAPVTPATFVPGQCWANCYACANVGSGPVQGILNMLDQYPHAMRGLSSNPNSVILRPAQYGPPMSFGALKAELDSRHPVIAGISPGHPGLPVGQSQHAVLIVGYDQASNTIVINDPFDYQHHGMMPPYLPTGGTAQRPGQFIVPYAAMLSPMIAWNTSVFGISP